MNDKVRRWDEQSGLYQWVDGSDTPRTDKTLFESNGRKYVPNGAERLLEVARTLERELADVRAKLAESERVVIGLRDMLAQKNELLSATGAKLKESEQAIKELARYFTSLNAIPVERAVIHAKDFWRIVGDAARTPRDAEKE